MKRSLLASVLAAACLGLLATPTLAGAATFTVHPSGGNDTANIDKAFDRAVKAGPGSTVQLTKGRFHMNDILVESFRGCFRGAGMGATVIDTLRGRFPNGPGVTLTVDPDDPNSYVEPWTFLIGFLGGSVRVSDMSFDITSPTPAKTWGDAGYTNVSDVFVVARDASSAFDRVGFTAHAGDAEGYNTANDIGIYGPTAGTHSVTRCRFTGRLGLEIVGLTEAELTVGGSPAQGNVFNESFAACFGYDNSDSDVEISHNRMRSSAGANVFLYQGGGYFPDGGLAPLPAPRYAVRHNTILCSKVTADDGSITAGAAGVFLEDDSWFYEEPTRLDAVIADNIIVLDNGGYDAGVDGFYADGIRVLRNRIFGTGFAGVAVGTDVFAEPFGIPAGPSTGWKIVDNDVSGVKPVNAFTASGEPAAPIWLGPLVNHCLVVGGCRPTRVLDQGTDNVLINVIRLPLPAISSSRAAGPMNALSTMKALKPVE